MLPYTTRKELVAAAMPIMHHNQRMALGFRRRFTLTALTLAAGKVIGSRDPVDVALALRIAAAASLSGGVVFFVAEYARLRRELVHAERQLNLTLRGGLAATRLGGKAFRQTLKGTTLSGTCSFLGALLPLVSGAVLPRPPWLPIS